MVGDDAQLLYMRFGLGCSGLSYMMRCRRYDGKGWNCSRRLTAKSVVDCI